MEASTRIGIDVGGSHLSGVRTTDTGEVLAKASVNIALSKYADPGEALIQALVELVKQLNDGTVVSIGMGVPGVFEGTVIERLINLGIFNFPLGDKLMPHLPSVGLSEKTPIVLINDAAAAAVYEVTASCGGLRGIKRGAFYTLGTGLGASLIMDGVVQPTEGGHIVLNRRTAHTEEELCGCGCYGCAEVYLSVKRLREKISRLLGLRVSNNPTEDQTICGIDLEAIIKICFGDAITGKLQEQLANGENKTPNVLELLYLCEEEESLCLYKEWVQDLILLCRSNVNSCGTSKIVLGGSGVFCLRDADLQRIQDEVNRTNNYDKGGVTIARTDKPTGAGAIGAALYPVYLKSI